MKGKYKFNIKGIYLQKDGTRTYRWLYLPFYKNCWKNNYFPEHRYVMEKHLGRSLKTREHVHHKNGNTLDNRISNLQVMTVNQHAKRHYSSKRMVEGRKKKYKSGWNPNLKGENNPNWKGGKVIKYCANKKCKNFWYIWLCHYHKKSYCSKICRI